MVRFIRVEESLDSDLVLQFDTADWSEGLVVAVVLLAIHIAECLDKQNLTFPLTDEEFYGASDSSALGFNAPSSLPVTKWQMREVWKVHSPYFHQNAVFIEH